MPNQQFPPAIIEAVKAHVLQWDDEQAMRGGGEEMPLLAELIALIVAYRAAPAHEKPIHRLALIRFLWRRGQWESPFRELADELAPGDPPSPRDIEHWIAESPRLLELELRHQERMMRVSSLIWASPEGVTAADRVTILHLFSRTGISRVQARRFLSSAQLQRNAWREALAELPAKTEKP